MLKVGDRVRLAYELSAHNQIFKSVYDPVIVDIIGSGAFIRYREPTNSETGSVWALSNLELDVLPKQIKYIASGGNV